MSAFRIYVVLDDVVTETARALAELLFRLHGRRVRYEKIAHFDLKTSFALTEAAYLDFMERAHEPDILSELEETPGACKTLRSWLDEGLLPVVVTGRPATCHVETRLWLDHRGLPDLPILHANKYQRPSGATSAKVPVLAMDELASLGFALAIDDAPVALDLLAAHVVCPCFVFDRPWNRQLRPGGHLSGRVSDWVALDATVRRAARLPISTARSRSL